MAPKQLRLAYEPKLTNATLLLALAGWMDGGDVSTGTVKQIMGRREVKQVGRIDPDEFYIYNFPGDMETAAMFRPAMKYDDGIVTAFEMPANVFWSDESANLVFFVGREPNLRWQTFADCIFALAKRVGVTRIVFMGSFRGSVPHTREPRLRPLLEQYGLRPGDYEGPGSFATLLLSQAKSHGIEMFSLVAEIPGYLQGTNPLSIEAISRRLARLLDQPIDMDAMREASNRWETQVTAAVEEDEDLAATIRKLEEQYDNELISSEGP